MSQSRFSVRAGRCAALVLLLLAAGAALAMAHDMFLKPTRYFVPENAEVRVRVLNGTFTRSENSITRDRLADASVLTPARRVTIDTTEWTVAGDTSTLHVHTRGPALTCSASPPSRASST